MAAIAKRAGFESMMMLPGDVHDADNPLVEDLGQSKQQAWDLAVQELSTMVDIAESNAVEGKYIVHIFDNDVLLSSASFIIE